MNFLGTAKNINPKNLDFKIGDYLNADIHSHLIPGIDDGSPDVESSMILIKGMIELGYKKLFITPHIHKELYANDLQTISQGFQILQKAVAKENLSIELYFGAEYFLEFEFSELLKKETLLSFGNNYLLMETSFVAPYPHLEETIFELKVKGYKPILAHPERYRYELTIPQVKNLKNKGCLMQVNLLSFTGSYGKNAQIFAYKLLEEGLIDFLGSDLHHETGLLKLGNLALDSKLLGALEKKSFLNCTL